MTHASQFLALVDDAKQRIKEISASALQQEQQHAYYLVDTREDREWQQGAIPDAIHLSKGIIERDIEATIPDKTAMIILYCGGGYRSALAADNLQKMGYSNVFSLTGGYHAWQLLQP